ncbi:hypothetical protein BJ912DRAFT_528219 [Pholiota molesta]|nr:hypothetical protein BJ912DRAFT_528219 [Pholiota molesta]
MLFSELACFSPDVPNAIKKIWVTNGGTLTHTSTDFQHAQFFFCNDIKDPWLNELLSRSLIVRHASWVAKCVAEGFRMPIAPYTLDDAFDEAQIPHVEILKSVTSTGSRYENITGRASAYRPASPVSAAKAYTRKRPFDTEGDSEVHAHQRPKKKARVEVRRPKDSQSPRPNEKVSSKSFAKSKDQAINNDSGLHPISLKAVVGKGKGTGAVKAFQRHVAQRKVLGPPRTPKKLHSDTLAPHTMFWIDLMAKRSPRYGSTTLNLSVGDLLQAPDTNAAIFDLNETYLGRRFINLII